MRAHVHAQSEKAATSTRTAKPFRRTPLRDPPPDFPQIELRVLAALSGEPILVGDFAAGADVHATTASLLFGKPKELVTAEERQVGKEVNVSGGGGGDREGGGQVCGQLRDRCISVRS